MTQSYVKLQALLVFSPDSDYTDLYCSFARLDCDAINRGVGFSINTNDEDEIRRFIAGSMNGKKSSTVATISRGQSKAYDYIPLDIAATFFQFCPLDCPLRTGSSTAETDTKRFANSILNTEVYKTSQAYDFAWFQSCLVAIPKAQFVAISIIKSLRNSKPTEAHSIPGVWPKNDNESR